ncbi:MAG: TRAP transporter small permease subunit [Henriciella sp.]
MGAETFLVLGSFLKWVGIVLLPLLLLPLLTLIVPKPFSGIAQFVSSQIDRTTSVFLSVAIVAAVGLVLFQLTVVIASYAFALSWTWLSELVIYAFAAVFMLGAASALKDDAHVRVDILRPRFGENGRSWIELAGTYLFLFPICIRILTTGEQGLARAWSLFEGSRESDGLPLLFLFKTLVPVFAVLLIAQGLSIAIKAALHLAGEAGPEAQLKSTTSDHYGA